MDGGRDDACDWLFGSTIEGVCGVGSAKGLLKGAVAGGGPNGGTAGRACLSIFGMSLIDWEVRVGCSTGDGGRFDVRCSDRMFSENSKYQSRYSIANERFTNRSSSK